MNDSTYVKCEACVHWDEVSQDGRFGTCTVTLPPWVPEKIAEDGDGGRETGKWNGCDIGRAKQPAAPLTPR